MRDEDRALLGLVDDWRTFLQDSVDQIEAKQLERHTGPERPLGSEGFVTALEARTGRGTQAPQTRMAEGPEEETECGVPGNLGLVG